MSVAFRSSRLGDTRQTVHAVGPDTHDYDHRGILRQMNRGDQPHPDEQGFNTHGTHTVPLPSRRARAAASATCAAYSRRARGHALRHSADHEAGPHDQQPHTAAVQCIGQTIREPVQAGFGRSRHSWPAEPHPATDENTTSAPIPADRITTARAVRRLTWAT